MGATGAIVAAPARKGKRVAAPAHRHLQQFERIVRRQALDARSAWRGYQTRVTR